MIGRIEIESEGDRCAGWTFVFARNADGPPSIQALSRSLRLHRGDVRADVHGGADDVWLATDPESGRRRSIWTTRLPDFCRCTTHVDDLLLSAVCGRQRRSGEGPTDDPAAVDDRSARQ